jgi:MoaA/NifB/PqqE/SkfB family radical SAM enzyme
VLFRSRRNVHELPALVRLCRDWGVDDLTFQYHLAFWGKEPWKESLSDEALREDEPAERYVTEATRLAKHIGLRFLCWRGDKYSVKAGRPCSWPWRSFYVTADRFVCPCCVACDPRIVNFGNLSEVAIRQVWNSPKYRRFRAAIRTGNIPTFCRGCYTDYTGVTELTD